jgi:hypothetical protein
LNEKIHRIELAEKWQGCKREFAGHSLSP